MGADGHIRYYDQGKVDKICDEINLKHGLKGDKRVSFPGYKCDYRVNGQPCCLVYWDNCNRRKFVDSRSKYGLAEADYFIDTWHDYDFAYNKEFRRIKKEFEDRCNAEAILVEDQEVWT